MPNDKIPASDDEFNKLQDKAMTAIVANPARYGLTDADVKNLQVKQAAWAPAFKICTNAKAAYDAAVPPKTVAREAYEPDLRATLNKINVSPGMDNARRAEVGLAAREDARRSIGVPESRPIARIEQEKHRTLVVHFSDENTPKRRAKPDGVQGCQVFAFVGDTPPVDPKDFSFLGLETRTPYKDARAAADAGKIVHYALRWQNAKGDVGPWSEVYSVKIPP